MPLERNMTEPTRSKRTRAKGVRGAKPQQQKPPEQPHPRDSEAAPSGHVSSEDSVQTGVTGQPGSNAIQFARAQTLTEEERLRALTCASVPEKVQFCYDLMVRFRWQKGRTDRELAELWDCARSTVWSYSSQAGHLSKLQLGDPIEHRARLAELMYSVGQSALERTEEVAVSVGDGGGAAHIEIHRVHKPDHRTALRSLVDIRDTLGLHSEPGENPYDAQSLDELLDQAADYLGKQGGEQG